MDDKLPNKYSFMLGIKIAISILADLTDRQIERLHVHIDYDEKKLTQTLSFKYKASKNMKTLSYFVEIDGESVTVDRAAIRGAAAALKLIKDS